MKVIRLPKESDTAIDLAAITPETKGIILAYKDDKPIGYIVCDQDVPSWGLHNTLDVGSDFCSVCSDDTLLALCSKLLQIKAADSFKLIEF